MSVERYGRRNNIVISGIPDDICDDKLENAVISIIEDVDVIIQNDDIKAYWGKSEKKTSRKKIFVRFVNRKYCKKH